MLEKVTKLGKKFYRNRLRNMLEPQENGKFVAIEPVQGKYFVREKPAFALQQGQTEAPDGYFYLMKISSPHAFNIGKYVKSK